LLEGRVCRRELGFPSQAAHLGHGRLLDHFGQAFDGDVAAVTQTLLQTAQRPDEQAVAQPADELTDPLVACWRALC
jgi:L-aminopeptidase/D-esterase-like protein